MIRVVIADSVSLYGEGLPGLFASQKQVQVVARAHDGRAAVDLCRDFCPQVLVSELQLPKLRGEDLIRQVVGASKQTRVIGLSDYFSAVSVWQALRAGADGLLHKGARFDELCDAINTVNQGQVYLGAEVQNLLVRDAIRKEQRGEKNRWSRLTVREREVAQLLVEGLSPKEIALELFLSVKTVDSHRYQLLKRLGVRNVADLTRLAVVEGVVQIR